jgi:DNA-directed RNA polymerase subunit RPC12/RpoP
MDYCVPWWSACKALSLAPCLHMLTPIHYCSAVTQSNNFIQAVQEEPFGDIVISRGPYLWLRNLSRAAVISSIMSACSHVHTTRHVLLRLQEELYRRRTCWTGHVAITIIMSYQCAKCLRDISSHGVRVLQWMKSCDPCPLLCWLCQNPSYMMSDMIYVYILAACAFHSMLVLFGDCAWSKTARVWCSVCRSSRLLYKSMQTVAESQYKALFCAHYISLACQQGARLSCRPPEL